MGMQRSGESLPMCVLSAQPETTTLFTFLKQKVFLIPDTPSFSFSCQLPLSFSLSYLLRETDVGR